MAGRNAAEPPLAHLVVDALGSFVATVVMMFGVLLAVAAWSMDWPVTFLGAVAVVFLAHAVHRRGLLRPTTSMPQALGHSVVELAPLAGGVIAAVAVFSGGSTWLAIGVGLIVFGLLGKLLA